MIKKYLEKLSDEQLLKREKIANIAFFFAQLYLPIIFYLWVFEKLSPMLISTASFPTLFSVVILSNIQKELSKRAAVNNTSYKVNPLIKKPIVLKILGGAVLVLLCFHIFFYNDFWYGKRFDRERERLGLAPFPDNWPHEKYIRSVDSWDNPNEKKDGLYHLNKSQSREFNTLNYESDLWCYNEGDSIEIQLYNYYFTKTPFGHETEFQISTNKGSLLKNIKTQYKNPNEFKNILSMLKHRQDSLGLGTRKIE